MRYSFYRSTRCLNTMPSAKKGNVATPECQQSFKWNCRNIISSFLWNHMPNALRYCYYYCYWIVTAVWRSRLYAVWKTPIWNGRTINIDSFRWRILIQCCDKPQCINDRTEYFGQIKWKLLGLCQNIILSEAKTAHSAVSLDNSKY